MFCRYGSDLASVESYRQNNFTADLAAEFLGDGGGDDDEDDIQTDKEEASYWLGLQAYNELQTNTLEADAGHQVRKRRHLHRAGRFQRLLSCPRRKG